MAAAIAEATIAALAVRMTLVAAIPARGPVASRTAAAAVLSAMKTTASARSSFKYWILSAMPWNVELSGSRPRAGLRANFAPRARRTSALVGLFLVFSAGFALASVRPTRSPPIDAPPGAGRDLGGATGGAMKTKAGVGPGGGAAAADRFDAGSAVCEDCDSIKQKRVRKRDPECDLPRRKSADPDGPSAPLPTRCERPSSE